MALVSRFFDILEGLVAQHLRAWAAYSGDDAKLYAAANRSRRRDGAALRP